MPAYWLTKRGVISSKPTSALSGKTPAEAVLHPETRSLLRMILEDPKARVSADLRAAAKEVLRLLARRRAPLSPLPPERRLGWLDEFTHLECRAEWPGIFRRDFLYPHRCHDIPTRRLLERKTVAGEPEEVLVSGMELLVTIHDDLRRLHAFANFPVPNDPRLHAVHDFSTLLQHFKIPSARDITLVLPAAYKKLKAALSAF